ncbi:MAG: NlpC/P60 family protein, partial [Desulfovibrionaceae bacterium]|nr:NlpC/P60 family protein [Desulfovibrionaceae bacterium]
TVRINRLSDSYFSMTFLGARRVSLEGNEDLVAQAQSRLTDYAEEKAVRELSAPSARKSNKKQASTQRAKKQRKAEARKSGKKRLEARKTEKQRAEARKAKKRRDRQARAERTAKKQPSVSRQKKKADVAHRHNSQKKRKQERS